MSLEINEVSPRARGLLAAGAIAGLLFGVAGILEEGPRTSALTPPGTAATVNGVPIETEEFERAVGLLASDSKNPVGPAEREHVLNRLIEEELLVQRARDLGVDQHDRRVRALLVRQMIDSIVADAQPDEPSQADVEQFYQENHRYFARTGRLAIEPLRFAKRKTETEEQSRARAEEAARRLRAGEERQQVSTELADPWIIPYPRGLLPATKVREYLGPTPTRKALTLREGEVSDPVRGGAAWYVLDLVAKEEPAIPPLERVEKEVRTEMQRRAGDRALRTYLDDLRDGGDVVVIADFEEAPN